MKLTVSVLLVQFLLCFLQVASADSYSNQERPDITLSSNDKTSFEAADSFLKRMGFEDYSAQARKTLETTEDIAPVSKWALQLNEDKYETLNGSRKVGNFTYALLKKITRQSPEHFNRALTVLTRIMIQQLKRFPQFRLEPLSIGNTTGMTIAQMLELREVELSKRQIERYTVEKINLVKAYLSIWPDLDDDEKVNLTHWLDEVFSDALWDTYRSGTHQQNRYLGRAIILAVVKYFRETGSHHLENKLASDLRTEFLFLENYIHGQYIQLNDDNKYVTHIFKSGDIAFEYSHGQEAFFTSLVVRPQKKENQNIAAQYKLINDYKDATKFLDTKDYNTAIDKKSLGLPLSFFNQRAYSEFWNMDYANGYSHCGLVEVRVDQQTGIKMAWIWDSFPGSHLDGGVRLMTPEGFSIVEKHLKLGVLRYDPKKVLSLFKEQISTRGYQTEVWKGYKSITKTNSDKVTTPFLLSNEEHFWPTKVDELTVKSWLLVTEKNAERWYQEIILPRVFNRVRAYVNSPDAVIFAVGLVSAQSMLYCSQLIVLAFLEATNLDLQDEQDKIPVFVHKLEDKIRNYINLNKDHRVVSPNGLIWQSKIFENLFAINLNREKANDHYYNIDGKTMAEIYTQYLSNLDEVKNTSLTPTTLISLPTDENVILDNEK